MFVQAERVPANIELWRRFDQRIKRWKGLENALPTNNGFSTFQKNTGRPEGNLSGDFKSRTFAASWNFYIPGAANKESEGETETFHTPVNQYYWKVVLVVWLFIHSLYTKPDGWRVAKQRI